MCCHLGCSTASNPDYVIHGNWGSSIPLILCKLDYSLRSPCGPPFGRSMRYALLSGLRRNDGLGFGLCWNDGLDSGIRRNDGLGSGLCWNDGLDYSLGSPCGPPFGRSMRYALLSGMRRNDGERPYGHDE